MPHTLLALAAQMFPNGKIGSGGAAFEVTEILEAADLEDLTPHLSLLAFSQDKALELHDIASLGASLVMGWG